MLSRADMVKPEKNMKGFATEARLTRVQELKQAVFVRFHVLGCWLIAVFSVCFVCYVRIFKTSLASTWVEQAWSSIS